MPSRSALSSCLAHFPADFSFCGSLVRFINGFRNQNKKKNNLKRVFAQFFRCPAAITDQQSKFLSYPHLAAHFTFSSSPSRESREKPPKKVNQSRECRVNGFWAHIIELAVDWLRNTFQFKSASEVKCEKLEKLMNAGD